ncbi:MAG: hypothetical protein LUQ44_06515, partial [Methanothrix sp.]|nr:hypothetical protein [Methanothrix sp.]
EESYSSQGRRTMMKEIWKSTLSIWLAVLLMAGICGTALAQPDGEPNGIEPAGDMGPLCRMGMQCEMMPPQNEGFPMGVPLEVLYSGHGQALKGNESHKLRLKIEAIMPMQPRQIRDLLSSNKSLEEIRGDIRSKGEGAGEKAFRGSMVLDRSMYPLINIAITSDNDNSTINADLADIARTPSQDITTLGSISLAVSPSGGKIIGEGELTILEGGKQETYSLILNMDGRRQTRKSGMAPPNTVTQ